ncbi:hypothetical protein ACGKJM_005475 [Citrobacter farmeri]
MYMHVDINGAYAAFECAMDPKLSKKPLIIASNNDSSVIAMNKLYLELTILRLCFLTRKESVCVHRCWHLYLT